MHGNYNVLSYYQRYTVEGRLNLLAFKVKFDSNYNPEIPSIVLATKGGKRLGLLPVDNLQFLDRLNMANEPSFFCE